MKLRLSIFLLATFFSLFGILGTLTIFFKTLSGDVDVDFNRLYAVFIFLGAWVFYFICGFQWVKKNRVPKVYKIAGTIFGLVSVLYLFKNAGVLLFVSAGILLMAYICIKVPSN
ncbi:MAG: hypothetical protein AB8B92_10040 [Gammaproteobacteria bacterium]